MRSDFHSRFVAVSPDIASNCRRLADAFFAEKAAEEFNGDLVDTNEIGWVDRLAPAWSLFPWDEVRRAGYKPARSGPRPHVVVTAGVDPHEDQYMGLALCWTLHNAGLEFCQRGMRVRPRAGEWFVFDDRLPHEMRSAPGAAVFIGVCAAVLPR